MDIFKNAQRIAYLGPGGSYTEMAKDVFCQKYEIGCYQEPFKSIRRVVEFVDENPNTLAVLPLENSVEGTVRETVDSLIKTKNTNIKFLAEAVLPIEHCLLARTTEIYSICNIISHPQAIAQCSRFIHDSLPMNLNIIEKTSTAEAAASLEGYNLTYAAIGSRKTAQNYNLNILKENINDAPDNQTRFVLIGDFEIPMTGKDKTTLAFSTENKAGALLDILQIFYKHNINLSYIESRPSKVCFGEYTFIIDFDGHILDNQIKSAVEELKTQAKYFRFIGSYEKYAYQQQ